MIKKASNQKIHERVRSRALTTTLMGRIVATGALVGGAFLLCPPLAHAMQLYSGTFNDQKLVVRLNTTLQYSNIFRVGSPSSVLMEGTGGSRGVDSANINDGDSNFRHGLVDNTFEVLPVFDVDYGNYGLYISGEAYVDTPYLGTTQNNQPNTYNAFTVDNHHFTSATRNVAGLNAELLDANVRGMWYFGADNNQSMTVKVGRQTLMWGQSLFFAGNGIAGGMAPVDIWKALSLPNAQTQQILLPVGQAVVTYQPNQVLTLQAYYQFEWRQSALPPSGSYFSYGDYLDKGGQRIIVGNGSYLYRKNDVTPGNNNGQFGASATLTFAAYSIGFYALRWDAKTPDTYVNTYYTGQPNAGTYWLGYAKDIQTYGASYSTDLGPVSFGAEASARRNMPLTAGFIDTAFGQKDPIGNTIAGQVSGIYISPGLPLDPGGATFMGEVAFNHVLSITQGKDAMLAGRQPSAAAFEFSVTPTYDSVLPNLNLNIPVGLSYDFYGNSEMDSTMNHGYGSYNIGVSATYHQVWTGGITYVGYFGQANSTMQDVGSLVDRSYVSFNLSRTF